MAPMPEPQHGKSLFASFSPEKEVLSFVKKAWLPASSAAKPLIS
jgi:hypothetical protein